MNRSQIVSFPVIALDNGSFVGQINDIAIDPQEKRVIGFEITNKSFFNSKSRYVSIKDVKTIGNYAVTITKNESLLSEESPGARDLIDNKFPIGKKIITPSGSFLGRVVDFSFELQNGMLDKVYIKNEEYDVDRFPLSAGHVLTLGKDVIIVDKDIPGEKKKTGQKSTRQSSKRIGTTLEDRAVDFALGRQVFRTVKDRDGSILINRGEIIRPEVIELAREKNRLAHLLFAAGVNEIIEGLDYTWEKIDEGSKKLIENLNKLKEERKSYENEKDNYANVINLDEKLFRYWQENLKRTFASMDFDYDTAVSLKNYLLNKVPVFRVKNEKGEILKEKNKVIIKEDLEAIHKPEDLVSLLSAVSAGELQNFVKSLEDQLISHLKNRNQEKNKILN